MPPKSNVFKQHERQILAPVMADLGFSRPRGVGLDGWTRREDSEWLVIWRQFNRLNHGDDPEGYTFTVELQLGGQPLAGLPGVRRRLYGLLTDHERSEHLAIHNAVAAKVSPDPDKLAGMPQGWRAGHLADLRPRAEPYPPTHDPWFRYVDEDDVIRWLRFVAAAMPGAIGRFLSDAAPIP